jgi:capsular polysaccharide biosynthesis protein
VLMQPKPPGLNSANPLLTFNASLNTTALIVVQALNAPNVATELGLTAGKGTFTVKNAGSVAVGGGQEMPFISVTAQSPDPTTSADIVVRVMDRAKQELVDRQDALNVGTRNAIKLESVVDATPPKPVLGTSLAARMGLVHRTTNSSKRRFRFSCRGGHRTVTSSLVARCCRYDAAP